MLEGMESWVKWERTRRNGRSRFLWIFGVLGFGMTTGIIGSVIMYLDMSGIMGRRHPVPELAILPLLVCPFGGYLWGVMMWHTVDSKYLSARKKAESEARNQQAIEDLTQEVAELRREVRKSKDDRIKPSPNQL